MADEEEKEYEEEEEEEEEEELIRWTNSTQQQREPNWIETRELQQDLTFAKKAEIWAREKVVLLCGALLGAVIFLLKELVSLFC